MAEISYENNTVVKVTIEGRITASDEHDITITTDVMGAISIDLFDPAVTVVVVAPPEWPPIAGDVWVDPKGNPYLYDHDRDELRDSDGFTESPAYVLKAVGQLRLVHRKPAEGGDR